MGADKAMTREEFQRLIATVTDRIGGRPLDAELARDLNAEFPPDSETFRSIERACHAGIADGWMCKYEDGEVRYGRVLRPAPETAGFSVDVVRMNDCAGRHHRHPHGEIDMIMPVAGDARFDGHGAGWCVYGPETAHSPTVSGGEAVVLYLLPEGAIDFTGTS